MDDIIVRKRKTNKVSQHRLPQAQSSLAQPMLQPAMAATMPLNPVQPLLPALGKTAVKPETRAHASKKHYKQSSPNFVSHLLNDYTYACYALILVILALIGTPIFQGYVSSNLKLSSFNQVQPASTNMGLNTSVNSSGLQQEITAIISQSATLNLGSSTVAIPASTIKSWLTIEANKNGQDNIHTDPATIAASLVALANSYVSSPVNQVTVTRADGTSEVAVAGRNGTKLVDPSTIPSQANTIAKNLFSNKGFQVNAPLTTNQFQALTPANFSKLLVADVNSKKLYAYQNGQLVNTFLVSAGKPSTPTPTGEYHIWAKLTKQTMTGPGYVQPNVPWVNYFDHHGDAIHGVYWRPASVFGNVNTSHGCVGIPISAAQWVFNWAPIGTTVITTAN